MKYFISLAFAASIMVSCQKKQEGASINLEVAGLKDEKVTIIAADNNDTISVLSLVDGKVKSALDITYPRLLAFIIESVQQPVYVFADLSPMELKVDFNKTPPFEFKGSAYNDSLEVFSQFQNANDQFMQELGGMWQQAKAASDSYLESLIMEKADSANAAFKQYTIDFASRNGILGAQIAASFLFDAEFKELSTIYDQIPARYADAVQVQDLKERKRVLENTQIGMRFTDIMQTDPSGNPISVSSVKGKYVLMDFWASWCGPCRRVNPELVEIYRQYNPKGFEIVGISLDSDQKNWLEAIAADGLIWTQMSDLKGWGNAGAAAYGIRSIPQSVLLDDQGFIVRKNLSPEELRIFLEKNL